MRLGSTDPEGSRTDIHVGRRLSGTSRDPVGRERGLAVHSAHPKGLVQQRIWSSSCSVSGRNEHVGGHRFGDCERGQRRPVGGRGCTNQTVDEGRRGRDLSGSGSSDPEGQGLTYTWIAGVEALQRGAFRAPRRSATPTFTAPEGLEQQRTSRSSCRCRATVRTHRWIR